MNKFHKEILEEIKKCSGGCVKKGSRYCGHSHIDYEIGNPALHLIAREWVRRHRGIDSTELLGFLDSLSAGESSQEKCILGMLLDGFPRFRRQVKPQSVDRWIAGREGWSEVDSLCQNVFQEEEILGRWDEWRRWLRSWSKDKDVHKRRASLVFLTGPASHSTEERLTDLAFESIERLKGEKDILITKAVSWLLRSIARKQPVLVKKYLEKNEGSLPKIAVREVRNKLKSGRKSGH